MGEAVVRLREVAQRFGGRWAFAPVSGEVAQGGRVWIQGGNGAGKTTVLRLIAGSLTPTWGEAWAFGVAAGQLTPALRRRVLLVTHAHHLYEGLDVGANLYAVARLVGHPRVAARRQVAAAVERVGLAAAAARPVRTFSAGMKRRATLARLLLTAPDLLLVDEPFAQLDGDGRRLARELLGERLAAGATLVFTSHQDDGAQALADQIWTLVPAAA